MDREKREQHELGGKTMQCIMCWAIWNLRVRNVARRMREKPKRRVRGIEGQWND